MKVKSSALFGLMVVICAISGFSLLKRFTQEVDEWRPSNLYSSTNLTRRSTFSVVSSAPASSSEAVATISSGSESLFGHGGATLYAPAMSMPSASMSMGPSSGGGLFTTSSAELRSFGGGGNGGGVSMSGGSVKSSGPSMASAGLGVSIGICVSNQGSNFQWCKRGVHAGFIYRKVVAALGDFKILYCVAMADEQDFYHCYDTP